MEPPSIARMRREPRSFGRTVIGAVILAATFGGALVAGALLHVNVPPARRLAARVLSDVLTSTFNGRVLDQGDAVLPGVTITATNTNTGVVRTTVTNAEGGYLMPGLEPGTYNVKTELSGFQPSERRNVTLGINATLTLDFKLALAGVNEQTACVHSCSSPSGCSSLAMCS